MVLMNILFINHIQLINKQLKNNNLIVFFVFCLFTLTLNKTVKNNGHKVNDIPTELAKWVYHLKLLYAGVAPSDVSSKVLLSAAIFPRLSSSFLRVS